MARFDTLRFWNVLVKGEIASEESAAQLTEVLNDEFAQHQRDTVSQDSIDVLRAEMKTLFAEQERDAALRDRQLTIVFLTALLAGLTLAVGLILGFG